MTIRRDTLSAFVLTLFLLPASCGSNNVGALFDPVVDPGGDGPNGPTDASGIQALPVGGRSEEGRPAVDDVFPTGSGWPSTVPIVVVFDESVNEDTVVGPAGGTPGLFVAPTGTQQAVPATYDFLLGGTAVIIRPAAPLPTGADGAAAMAFDIVVDPGLTDVDGIRFTTATDPEVVGTFTPDASDEVEDGQLLTVLPVDNSLEQLRENPVYGVFTRPVNAASLNTMSNNFRLRAQGSVSDVPGTLSFPLPATPPLAMETRVVEFLPTAILDGSTEFQLFVDETITFGTDGELDFFGRSPFSVFDTVGVAAPLSVAIGNPTTGFDPAINRNNLASLLVDVELDADTIDGDTVEVRIYGGEPDTDASGDLVFVERSSQASGLGAQTVTVSFAGALGILENPLFEGGDLTLTARTIRGQTSSGAILSDDTAVPRFDIVPPEITEIGPPSSAGSLPDVADLVIDQREAAFYGTASERLGAVEWTIGGNSTILYGAGDDGRFLTLPLDVGFSTGGARPTYTLTATDTTGNMSLTALSGDVVQRGVVSGTLPGELIVEVYDETTFLPVAAATVVIEPGAPQSPAVGQVTAVTGTDGRVAFPGLSQSSYTITVLADGFDLVTLLECEGTFASLPVAPLANATGSLAGGFGFGADGSGSAPTGSTIAVGTNVFADPTTEFALTPPGMPTALAPASVRPNRPVFVTAFSGVFPPTSIGTFGDLGCGVCGIDLITATPPFAPIAPGGNGAVGLALIPQETVGATTDIAAPISVNFGTALGLGSVVGTPSANFVASLRGVSGMTLVGIGRAIQQSGAVFAVDGRYSNRIIEDLTFFSSIAWLSTEAQDAAGNASRVRAIVSDANPDTVLPSLDPPGIPTVIEPMAASVGSPEIVFEDRIDITGMTGLFALFQLTAFDPDNRRWVVFGIDSDAAGAQRAVQLPSLTGVAATGLAAGVWTVEAETFITGSTNPFTPNQFVLEERFRQAQSYARAVGVPVTVQ